MKKTGFQTTLPLAKTTAWATNVGDRKAYPNTNLIMQMIAYGDHDIRNAIIISINIRVTFLSLDFCLSFTITSCYKDSWMQDLRNKHEYL